MFWVSFPFGMLSFAMPVYGRDLGASALEIGALFSTQALVSVIVCPFLGRAVDRWGRWSFLLLGFAEYLAAMIVLALADQVWILTLDRFIQRLVQALLWLAALRPWPTWPARPTVACLLALWMRRPTEALFWGPPLASRLSSSSDAGRMPA